MCFLFRPDLNLHKVPEFFFGILIFGTKHGAEIGAPPKQNTTTEPSPMLVQARRRHRDIKISRHAAELAEALRASQAAVQGKDKHQQKMRS